jgi:hypothetical protein
MTTIPLVHVGAEDAPVACSLAPGEYRSRTAGLSSLAARARTARASIDGGERLTFIDVPTIERELRAAVAAEASCCSFLTMSLQRADGTLVLDITGPAQARPIIAALFT